MFRTHLISVISENINLTLYEHEKGIKGRNFSSTPLESTAHFNNWPLQLLRVKDKFRYIDKFLETQRYVRSEVADDDFVLFVDAFDVLIYDSPEVVREKYYKNFSPKDVFFCAETYMYPVTEVNTEAYRKKNTQQGISAQSYLNSGVYGGTGYAVKELHKREWPQVDPEGGDQSELTRIYLFEKSNIVLDHSGVIAQSVLMSPDLVMRNGRVYNTKFQQFPSVAHWNGWCSPESRLNMPFFKEGFQEWENHIQRE